MKRRGSNRLFGWFAWREMNPQWPSLGVHVAALKNNLHMKVELGRRAYSIQLWRTENVEER